MMAYPDVVQALLVAESLENDRGAVSRNDRLLRS